MNKKLEEKYEQYKSGKMDAVFEALKSKVEQKSATREEYDEFKKMTRIKENIKKVSNIKGLISKLKDEKNEIKVLLEKDKKIIEAKKQVEKLEKEMIDLNIKQEEIKSQLKSNQLTPEKRIELEAKLKETNLKVEKNNSEFQKNNVILLNANQKEEKISRKDLEKKAIEISSKISKCNMVCTNLMKGLSWDSIEVKLDNWKERTYTKKSGMDVKSVQKGETGVKEPETKNNKEQKDKGEAEDKEEDEQSLVEAKTFAEKHPRIAKIINWFKGLFSKNKATARQVEQEENEEHEKQKEEFKEYIKQVAEKGLDGIEAEKRAKAKEKLEKAKQEAIKRQNEKLGKDYSKNSGDER